MRQSTAHETQRDGTNGAGAIRWRWEVAGTSAQPWGLEQRGRKIRRGRQHQRRVFLPRARREQHDGTWFVDHLDLSRENGRIAFLFVLFPTGDLFAQAAGMGAVEGPLHRLDKRGALRVLHEHRSPRDGLQHEPVRAAAHEECEHEQEPAGFMKKRVQGADDVRS